MSNLGVGPALSRADMGAMSFLEHLEELRKRIIWSIVWVAAGFFACWWKADYIYGFMQKPIIEILKAHKMEGTLVFTNPTDIFNLYLKVALLAGLFVASPAVLYQVWAFIAPGLYRHEKKYVIPFMCSTVVLFLLGGWFAYQAVYPAALNFLIEYSQQAGAQFKPMITVGEYTDLFLTIVIGMGIIFEMPILVFFLALMGLINAKFMWNNLRYSILVIFIIAAIVTPTTDIMNMCLFAAPMVALYILSIGIAWFVHPAQRKKRAEKNA